MREYRDAGTFVNESHTRYNKCSGPNAFGDQCRKVPLYFKVNFSHFFEFCLLMMTSRSKNVRLYAFIDEL